MPFKEKIKIEERLTIYIRNKDTGEVTTIEVKRPDSKKTIWDKILERIGIKAKIGSVTNVGFWQIGREIGGIGTSRPINQMGAYYDTTWLWKTSNNQIIEGGPKSTLVIDNEANPWTEAYNFNHVGCQCSTGPIIYNTIPVTVNNGAGILEWWAEIQFVFT